jgi:hypothetical protein
MPNYPLFIIFLSLSVFFFYHGVTGIIKLIYNVFRGD